MRGRLGLILPLAAAACMQAPQPAPPVAIPVPLPVARDWRDLPLTPGMWSYRDAMASFGEPGQRPRLVLRCDRVARLIVFEQMTQEPMSAGTVLTITTSYGVTALVATMDGAGKVGLSRAAADPMFDAMAFSRGRFILETPGLPTLALPAWAEVSRVVEECRA